MTDFMNWETLGTFAGISVTVTTLTQILKQFLVKTNPKWIALVLSLILTFGYQFFKSDISLLSFIMSAVNALLVTSTAIGAFESVIKPVVRRQ